MTSTDKAILCLCHDKLTLRVRRLLLQHFGYKVLATESARDLSAIIGQSCPDMLLMDDAYPGLDYEHAAQKAKTICPDMLAVVLVPGYLNGLRPSGAVDRFLSIDGPREEWLAQIESLFEQQQSGRNGRHVSSTTAAPTSDSQ